MSQYHLIRIEAPLIGNRPFVSASLHRHLPGEKLLLDSGAQVSICTKRQYEQLKELEKGLLLQPETSVEIRSQTNHRMKVLGSIYTDLHFHGSLGANNILRGVKFFVVDEPEENQDPNGISGIVLGGSLLRGTESSVLYRKNHVFITLQSKKRSLPQCNGHRVKT